MDCVVSALATVTDIADAADQIIAPVIMEAKSLLTLFLFFVIVIAPLISVFVLVVLIFVDKFVLFIFKAPFRVFPFVVSIAYQTDYNGSTTKSVVF